MKKEHQENIHNMIEGIIVEDESKSDDNFHQYLQSKLQTILHGDEQKSNIIKLMDKVETETANKVRDELTEQWVRERDTLAEEVDDKVDEYLERVVGKLETEYAEKFVEAKAAMSEELKEDLMELVEKVDAFLEQRIEAEFDELKEDIKELSKKV